ncbi:FCD domain-containing protein [Amycolatopsis pigmentata]|uniref:FCD domain-containing protein n=1 Tax=Amycolatopsis pigmentata TaxID=450801 RepID=A0ABW5G4D3_9PSEU
MRQPADAGDRPSLRQEVELYLHWSVSFGDEPDRDLATEHRQLLDAAIARDADRAQQLLRDHIAHTTRLLIRCDPDPPNKVRS